jgi:type IV pilus assembly protein PilA
MYAAKSGFTLLELLIVIAIIGILASVLITSVLKARERSYDIGATACAKSIQTAQGISQVDKKTFLVVGAGSTGLNRTTDGINSACGFTKMFVSERSTAGTIQSDYVIDIWDGRGSNVYTITPSSFTKNAPGAPAFSTSGPNLP